MLTEKRIKQEQATALEFIHSIQDELAKHFIDFEMYKYEKEIHTYKTNKQTEKQYLIHYIYYKTTYKDDLQIIHNKIFSIAHQNNKIDLHANNEKYISIRIYK